MPRLDEDLYAKIISDYESGMTQSQVAETNGIGRDAVGNILRRFDVPIREYTGSRSEALRKWTWNYSFFENTTSPVVAYYGGLFFADGNISPVGKNSWCASIALHENDVKSLTDLCYYIDLDVSAIKHYDGYCLVQLNHPNINVGLSIWGVTPNKTYDFHSPLFTETEMLPHFLRGWADGDGSIYRYGNGSRFTLSGNTQSLYWYADALKYLGYTGNVSVKPMDRSDVASLLYIGGQKQVSQICDLLLADEYSMLRMDRKWTSRYDSTQTTVTHICEVCGASFEVSEWRHNNEPENGRFCSKECFDIFQRGKTRIVEDGVEKKLCSHCNTYKSEEDWSANSAYCRSCWNERARNYRNSRKRN